jgi:hypothetical protein
MLVIMLLITPRTFLSGGALVLGRRGFTNGPSSTGVGIGGRPWLQKVAALTVAISLTIATADSLKVAERQYNVGYMDATALQVDVENSTELKVIRVISDTFLWLAQAQTLIRLFPRQREKIIIKWTAFALIGLDVLFSILNNFVYVGSSRPRSFTDAIPALSYLFQLALGLLYCAWVMYYSITKRRYAFYHAHMRNICLVALLSLLAVLVPVVFFVLDISKPDVAGWGDYVRWVGAAAASVVVWEWVERIEALERNDKKDGVLGREIFDGDEMLEVTPSSETKWVRRLRRNDGSNDGGNATGAISNAWPSVSGLANRYVRPRANQDIEANKSLNMQSAEQPPQSYPLWPARPPAVATPVSRTDTASAESTVYAVRYHPISESTPPIPEHGRPGVSRSASMALASTLDSDTPKETVVEAHGVPQQPRDFGENALHILARANPFKRKGRAPPLEVSAHAVTTKATSESATARRWPLHAQLTSLAAQAERLRNPTGPATAPDVLPVTVIPAPPRRRAIVEEEEERTIPVQAHSMAPVLQHENLEGGNAGPRNSSPVPTNVGSSPLPGIAEQEQNAHSGGSHFTANVHSAGGSRDNVVASPSGLGNDTVASPSSPSNYSPFRTSESPLLVRQAQTQASSSHSPVSARRDDMPFTSIPAPPRRRTPEE